MLFDFFRRLLASQRHPNPDRSRDLNRLRLNPRRSPFRNKGNRGANCAVSTDPVLIGRKTDTGPFAGAGEGFFKRFTIAMRARTYKRETAYTDSKKIAQNKRPVIYGRTLGGERGDVQDASNL